MTIAVTDWSARRSGAGMTIEARTPDGELLKLSGIESIMSAEMGQGVVIIVNNGDELTLEAAPKVPA